MRNDNPFFWLMMAAFGGGSAAGGESLLASGEFTVESNTGTVSDITTVPAGWRTIAVSKKTAESGVAKTNAWFLYNSSSHPDIEDAFGSIALARQMTTTDNATSRIGDYIRVDNNNKLSISQYSGSFPITAGDYKWSVWG